ncbi:PaaI family thioesterase [Desulfitobacterium hafniense]|nr:PaaI family thioesterase [Desulfitobacterium hafniense]ACL20965.1 thioesterase superfamily protein [Desulfitobacterium hafniense DCB-2]KTE91237.1 thioesterase [Desulfitobacterium hafniense]MEA5023848.1 PaaI family thioesterase [Desulfitobacterium hafniense]CDX01851.1 Thioesterase super protein [Desulfitobacterium hafniense]
MANLEALGSSNIWKYLGMTIVTNEQGKKGVKITTTDKFKQAHGSVHGGIIATVIDTAMGVAVNEAIGPDRYAVTVELKVNYLLPVVDSDIYAYAHLVKEGKRLFMGTVNVYDEDGKLVAIGSATFSMITRRKEQL